MSRRGYGPPGGGGGFGSMGFPPLVHSARILIIINVAVWALMLIMFYSARETLASIYMIGALTPELVMQGYVHQLFTYMFMHDLNSPFHVLLNMLLVYFFAASIEQRYGVKKTILLALGAGLAGGLMVMIFYWIGLALGMGAVTTTVGFSGAALGLLAAFCWIHAEAKILLFFIIPIKAKYILPLTIGIDFLLWVTPGSDVSFAAHLGGIILGSLVATDMAMPDKLRMRLRYWKIQRELKKRQRAKAKKKGKGGDDDKVVDGPWVH